MTTQHTPGPWAALEDDGMWGIYPANSDGDPIVWQMGGIDNESDACLIAAAPELLAACEAIVGAWQSSIETPWLFQVRAAIAKARGA